MKSKENMERFYFAIQIVLGCTFVAGLIASSMDTGARVAIGAGVALLLTAIETSWYAFMRKSDYFAEMFDVRMNAIEDLIRDNSTNTGRLIEDGVMVALDRHERTIQSDSYRLAWLFKYVTWIVGGIVLAYLVPRFVA